MAHTHFSAGTTYLAHRLTFTRTMSFCIIYVIVMSYFSLCLVTTSCHFCSSREQMSDIHPGVQFGKVVGLQHWLVAVINFYWSITGLQ